MLFGPIFRSELIMTARRKRYYVARVLYGLALLFLLRQEFAAEQSIFVYWSNQ